MERYEIGMLARSKAGHDKDTLYVIVDADASYIYLSDGALKTKEHPKRKKRKHVQPICKQYDLTGIDNVGIKRILKVYGKEMRGE